MTATMQKSLQCFTKSSHRPNVNKHQWVRPNTIPKRTNQKEALQQCHCHRSRGSVVYASAVIDSEFVEELNKVSNRTLEVLSAGSEDAAMQLSAELQEMREFLEEVDDKDSSRFLKVLQGMLDHKVLKEIRSLDGLYARATDRILNQVAGSSWKLVEEGKEHEKEADFSTWEDVMNGKKGRSSPSMSSDGVKDMHLYNVLGVEAKAEAAEIKSAFRKLALKLHPDVSDAPDANQQFAELSRAYDVLSDPETRRLYDEVGLDIEGMQEVYAKRGSARDLWEEFKPFTRQNKHTRARASSQVQPSEQSTPATEATSSNSRERVPNVGDLVEYPLRTIETEDFQDGRSHGVGLLVSRNMDRGDAKTLPVDQLPLCEIESLRQEEPDSDRWVADELGITSFARLEEMRIIPVAAFNDRHDVWTIRAPLSPGCGGPPLPEEVIL